MESEFDYTKPEHQVLIDLIRKDNAGKVLTINQVRFGTPTPHTPEAPILRNTMIVATAQPESRYSGSQAFYYDRVNISDFPRPFITSLTFQIEDEETTVDLIPKINERLGVNLSVESVIVDELPEGSEANIPFRIAPGSLVYLGQLGIKIIR